MAGSVGRTAAPAGVGAGADVVAALAGHAVYAALDVLGAASLGLTLALDGLAGYAQALGALLVAAIAAAVTHAPGGWGVLDFVLVRSLGGKAEALIVAVLVYRAAYYLLPLAAASLLLPWPRRAGALRAQRP